MTQDSIHIDQLELSAHIGVPEEERLHPQRLTLQPKHDFTALDDQLTNTVDYFALTRRVRDIAAQSRWKLIESLAQEIATRILAEFDVQSLQIELRKYILPDTNFVAVRIAR
jgi:7,8-dihydroneopterin aldolase/epimerase/oxygenase